MFSADELQQLIAGSPTLDVYDLKLNTHYSGGFDVPNHPAVIWFWEVFEDMSEDDKRLLLVYVTGCPRGPLLGFKFMDPKFTLRCSGGDVNNLPTASACFNLLKFPNYPNKYWLQEKLLYAIRHKPGFELS